MQIRSHSRSLPTQTDTYFCNTLFLNILQSSLQFSRCSFSKTLPKKEFSFLPNNKKSKNRLNNNVIFCTHGDEKTNDFIPNPTLDSPETNESNQFAIIMEVENVMVDFHRHGHKEAFNNAFLKLGLDCANWNLSVYFDLHRQSGGNEEEMVRRFFEKTGWPSFLPTSEKDAFVKNVLNLKNEELEKIIFEKKVPLRPGLEEFLKEAINSHIPVFVICAFTKLDQNKSNALVNCLDEECLKSMQIIDEDEVLNNFYGNWILNEKVTLGSNADVDELVSHVSNSVLDQKQKIAEEISSILKIRVDLDTNSNEIFRKSLAALRTASALSGLPAQQCVALCGSSFSVQSAVQAGMPCIVIRSSTTSQAQFPKALATMDGFGYGGDLNLNRIKRLLKIN